MGRYVVEKLLARGDAVRVLARGSYPELAAAGAECRQGDLRQAQDVDNACRDIDTVFHAAALAGLWGRRRDFVEINVDGTQNVLDACRAQGVGRLVYTSTPSVVFGMDDLAGANESQPYPNRYYAPYPETKAIAEQAVLAANGSDGLVTCALRPHLVWGPRDRHIIPMLAERARAGRLVQIGDGSNVVDVCYVENAADAHLQAADALDGAAAGQAYFISDGAPVNLWDWVKELLRRLDLPPVSRNLSYRSAYAIGAVMEAAYRVLPLPGAPLVTRFSASNFAKSHYFDISKAKADLGYSPQVGNAEGLDRTAAWYRAAYGADQA